MTTTWLSLGVVALEYPRLTPADLLILDIGLLDISGFETGKQLRLLSLYFSRQPGVAVVELLSVSDVRIARRSSGS